MLDTKQKPQTLEIEDPSDETIIKMLNTVPLKIIHGGLDWTVAGVKLPKHDESSNRYLGECEQHRVIPYTSSRFRFDPERRIFKLNESELKRVSGNEMVRAIQDYIDGKKINDLGFTLGYLNRSQEGLDQFRNCFMKSLLDQGYVPTAGSLWLTSYHMTGYNQGDEMDDGIRFSTEHSIYRSGEPKMELLVGRGTTPEETEKLTEWFNSLR